MSIEDSKGGDAWTLFGYSDEDSDTGIDHKGAFLGSMGIPAGTVQPPRFHQDVLGSSRPGGQERAGDATAEDGDLHIDMPKRTIKMPSGRRESAPSSLGPSTILKRKRKTEFEIDEQYQHLSFSKPDPRISTAVGSESLFSTISASQSTSDIPLRSKPARGITIRSVSEPQAPFIAGRPRCSARPRGSLPIEPYLISAKDRSSNVQPGYTNLPVVLGSRQRGSSYTVPSDHIGAQNNMKSAPGYATGSVHPMSWASLADDLKIPYRSSDLKNLPPFDKDPLSLTEINCNILDLLQQPLEQKSLTEGHVYAFSIEDYSGYMKIGQTKNLIPRRAKEIERCIQPYNLKANNPDDFRRFSNYKRVERLVFAELRNKRRRLRCNCKATTTDIDYVTDHAEWFAIGEDEAFAVVNRWRNWMASDPYIEGMLRPSEQLKIDYYKAHPSRVQWNEFMNFPRWKSWYIWFYQKLHKRRAEKRSCSRWDSLRKHWMLNLIIYTSTLLFSYALFFARILLPSTYVSIHYFVFTNGIMLGGLAILYAA